MSERSERPLSIWEMIWKQPRVQAEVFWNCDLFVVEVGIGLCNSGYPDGTVIAELWKVDGTPHIPSTFYYDEDVAQTQECWEEELLL